MSQKRSAGTTIKYVVAGVLLVVVLILVVQNQEPVSTEVLLWSIEAPRFALLALVFLAGVVAGYVLGRSTRVGGAG